MSDELKRGAATDVAPDDVLARDASADVRAFYLQAAFRALLDAMARPGELAELPAPEPRLRDEAKRCGLTPSALMLADVLIDAATTFAVAGTGASAAAPAAREPHAPVAPVAAERELSIRTHCPARPVDEALYVFVPAAVRGEAAAAAVKALTPGTLASPHLGATCVVECGTLLGASADGARTGSASGSEPTATYVLSGPGVDGTAQLTCDRAEVVDARLDRADEFPCGIDLVFVDGAGHVACIPRSTKVGAAEGAAPADAADIARTAADKEGGSAWAM